LNAFPCNADLKGQACLNGSTTRYLFVLGLNYFKGGICALENELYLKQDPDLIDEEI